MEQYNVAQRSGGSGEDSPTSSNDRPKVYDTPPTSLAEAMSPVSSKNRGQLRAASLGISPSAGRSKGLGNPSSSFGAGVLRVPAPIFTKQQRSSSDAMYPQNVRESFPGGTLPPITQVLNGALDNGYPQDFGPYSQNYYTNHAVQASQSPQPRLNGYDGPVEAHPGCGDAEINDPIDINPYAHRADEIGPSHHIPGVVHLGDSLEPPGWKEGGEPINPRGARLLFSEARLQAKKALKASIDETKNLPVEQQEKFNAERDQKWDVQFKLDQLLLTERINVYDMYQERKRKKLHNGILKATSPTRVLPPIQPQPINAMTSVPARLQSMHFKSTPTSPDMSCIASPPIGGYGANAGLQGGRFMQNISPSSLSPRVLDPSLLPGSYEAACRIYHANRAQIAQMNLNNDTYFSKAIAKYEPYLSQGQLSSSVLPPVTGQQARPFVSVHNGYVPQDQHGYPSPSIPRPPPYKSPRQYGTVTNSPRDLYHPHVRGPSACATNLGTREPTTQIEQEPAQRNGREVLGTNRKRHQNQQGSGRQSSQAFDDQEDHVTPKKKRAPRAKAEKKEPWYAEYVAAADLPTSVISAEALEAGRRWSADGPPKQKNPPKQKSPPKPRRGKPIIDPKKGMVISEAAAKVLIANGASDTRKKPAANAMPVVVHNRVDANAATSAQPTKTHTYGPAPTSEANYIFSRNPPTAEPMSETSTDNGDDPDDADYGRRSTRRKAPTLRKMDTPRKDITPSKKRNLEGPSIASKRVRLDVGGPEDEPRDNGELITGDQV